MRLFAFCWEAGVTSVIAGLLRALDGAAVVLLPPACVWACVDPFLLSLSLIKGKGFVLSFRSASRMFRRSLAFTAAFTASSRWLVTFSSSTSSWRMTDW